MRTRKLTLEQTFHPTPIIHEVEQGTADWFQVKLAKVSSSHMSDVQSSGTGRRSYMLQLLEEKFTGIPSKNGFKGNRWTEYGNEYEPQARAYYELREAVDVKQVGFLEISPDIGLSPDGLVGRHGGVEIKCRSLGVQMDTMHAGKMPPGERWQVQFSLWATGRKWWDYVSFCPVIPGDNKYFKRRQVPDPSTFTIIRREVTRFLNDMTSLEASALGSAIASRGVIT